MRTIEGSSRGRGGSGGRSGWRGGRGRGAVSGASDYRFAARKTDPRFQGSHRNRDATAGRSTRESAMLRDSRFAKYVAKPQDEEDEEEEEEDDSSEHSEGSGSANGGEGVASAEDDLVDDEEAAILDDDAQAWSGSDVEFCEATRRLAIVNCDWDHVRANDLYAILFHSLPIGGRLLHVKVYLSDFGKKMLEHEKMLGPDLWVKPGEEDDQLAAAAGDDGNGAAVEEAPVENDDDETKSGDDDEHNDDEDDDDGWVDDNPAMLTEVGEDGEMFSGGKHRKYERERMKYYYAIATFDSPDTAAAVYHELDGLDIEASGVQLDLRYVDDSETFDANPAQTCSSIPANFRPMTAFKSAALSQTRFRISWDQDDAHRHRSLQDAFTGTTEEDDLNAYIAADSSDEGEELDDPLQDLLRKRRDDKRAQIRRRYSELLAELGGLSEALPDDEGNPVGDTVGEDDGNSDASGSSNTSNDDDLNRLSDIDQNDSDDDGIQGNMEATIDFDAEAKASLLQRNILQAKQMRDADVGEKAALKHKLKRKESRIAKRELIAEEKAAARAVLEAEREANKANLRSRLGNVIEDMGGPKKSGKERRKEHTKAKKQEAAQSREEKKKLRLAGSMGIKELPSRTSGANKETEGDQQQAIDPRFASKLVADPRFHLDVSRVDKKANKDVVALASTVVRARQKVAKLPASAKQPATSDRDDVEYFLSRPQKRLKAEPTQRQP